MTVVVLDVGLPCNGLRSRYLMVKEGHQHSLDDSPIFSAKLQQTCIVNVVFHL